MDKNKDGVGGKENCRFMIVITIMLVLIETVLGWLVGGCNKMQSTPTSQIS